MEKPSKHTRFRQAPRSVGNLKEQLAGILRQEDLSRKLTFLQTFAEESGTDMEHVAAALLVLIERQRSRPTTASYGQTPRERPGQFRDRTRYRAEQVRDDSKAATERKPGRSHRPSPGPMTKYRIEVGRAHGVGPGQIVGAIAHESSLSGADIGGIDIQTHFSTVDLPQTMSDEVMRELRQVRVAGQALRISKWERGGDQQLREKPGGFKKKRGSKPTWKKSRKRVAPPAAN